MSESFLGRWSRRKLATREEESPPSVNTEEGAVNDKPDLDDKLSGVDQARGVSVQSSASSVLDHSQKTDNELNEAPLPTETDLTEIQQTGNISSFLSEKVSQELRNKAFKELFKIPSFNHVDMLDVYMEDFNKFTPLSVELRDKMALAKQLLKDPNEIEPTEMSSQEDEASETVESPENFTEPDKRIDSAAEDEGGAGSQLNLDTSFNDEKFKAHQANDVETSESHPIVKQGRENP